MSSNDPLQASASYCQLVQATASKCQQVPASASYCKQVQLAPASAACASICMRALQPVVVALQPVVVALPTVVVALHPVGVALQPVIVALHNATACHRCATACHRHTQIGTGGKFGEDPSRPHKNPARARFIIQPLDALKVGTGEGRGGG